MIWIPITFFLIGIIYNILYIYSVLSSYSSNLLVFRLSDFFCLMTIAFWETCIQIGLVQSNEGYDAYFWNASLNARIVNSNLDTVYMSKNALPLSRKQLMSVLEGGYKPNRNLRVKANKVRGGYAYWLEDLTEVNKINDKIEDVNEQLLGEYTLIRAEADLKEKKARLETQNKLYDHIADVIRPKLLVLENLLFGEEQSDSQFNQNLAYACVLNAYIKRRSNLMLIAENEEKLPIAELRMSIAETMEKLRKCDVVCQIFQDGDGTLGKDEMFLAYDFMEEIIERAMPDLSAFMVHLTCGDDGFLLQISLETPTMLPEKRRESLHYVSGSYAEMYVEEDAEDSNAYVCLTIKEEGQAT